MRVNCLIAAAAAMALPVWAQSGLAVPGIGAALDGGGRLRPVMGVAGSLWLGAATGVKGETAAFGALGGFVGEGEEAVSVDAKARPLARIGAAKGAVFGLTAKGAPSLVYLPESAQLVRVEGARTWAAPYEGDPIVALGAVSGDRAVAVVKRSDGLWRVEMETETGAMVNGQALVGVSGPAMVDEAGEVVYGRGEAIAIRDAAGREREVALGFEAGAITPVGAGWAMAVEKGGGRRAAVRTAAGREGAFPMPEEAR